MSPAEVIQAVRSSSSVPSEVIRLLKPQIAEHPSGEASDSNLDVRFEVAKELYRSLVLTDRHFAVFLLQQEIEAHRRAWSVHDSIVLCAGMLFQLAQPEDALLIWQAKKLTFDTDCGIPIGLLAGAGVDRTLDYWRSQSSSEAKDFVDYLTKAAYAGEFGDLTELGSETKRYLSAIAGC